MPNPIRAARRAFAAFVLLAAAAAHADGPTLTYAPAPDSAPLETTPLDCTAVGSTTPDVVEVDFAGAGCTPGQACTTSIVATATGGTDGFATVGRCSVVELAGDGDVTVPEVNLFFDAGQTTTGQIPLTCAPGTETTRARLCCADRSGNLLRTTPIWDVSCPSGGTPEFDSPTPPGATLPIETTIGTPAAAVLLVSNTGTGRLSLAPALAAQGLSLAPAAPAPLAAGATQSFTVTCDSANATTIEAALVFDTNDADEDPVAYTVRCVVVAPEPQLLIQPNDGETLTLGAATPSNAQATFTVTNPGNAPLELVFGGLDGALSVDVPSATLAAGAARTFSVTCDGAVPGAYNDELVIDSNAPARPQVRLVVDCTISGAEFEAEPQPGLVELASTRASGATVDRTLQIFNIGVGNLSVQASFAPGASAALSVVPASIDVGSNDSGSVTVRCARDTVGQFQGTLVLATNDPDDGEAEVRYPVTCGITADPVPEIAFDPDRGTPIAIATGTNVPGVARLVVSNAGSAALTVTSATEGAAGGAITVAPAVALPAAVAAGGMLAIDVRCLSASPGTLTDTLTIASSDADEPSVTFDVACTVTQVAPAPELATTPAAPGPIAMVGTFGTSTSVTLRNTGNASLVVASATGLSAPLRIEPADAVIAPGDALAFTIVCAARTVGTVTQTLTFATNDADESSVAFQVTCTLLQPPPEFGSDPEPKSELYLAAPAALDSSASGVVNLFNYAPRGARALTVVPGGLGGPLSAMPAGTIEIPPFQTLPVPLTVACRPTAVGTTTQELVLDTNAPNVDPARYSVVCEGTPGPDFDSVPRPGAQALSLEMVSGDGAKASIRLTNRGASTLRIASLSGLSAPLAAGGPTEPPLIVDPGASLDVVVVCGGKFIGTTQQTLRLTTNDPDEALLQYGVRCRGIAPDLLFEGTFEGAKPDDSIDPPGDD